MIVTQEFTTREKVLVITTIVAIGFRPVLREITPSIVDALQSASSLFSDLSADNGASVDDELKALFEAYRAPPRPHEPWATGGSSNDDTP